MFDNCDTCVSGKGRVGACPACPAHHPVRDVLGKELEIRVWSKVWPPCSHIGCVGLDSYAQRNLNFSRGSVLGSVLMESIILFLADHILSLSTSPHLTSNLPQPPSWQLWYVCFWVILTVALNVECGRRLKESICGATRSHAANSFLNAHCQLTAQNPPTCCNGQFWQGWSFTCLTVQVAII